VVPDEGVTAGLGLAEGIETALAVMQRAGWSPVWAATSAGAMDRFAARLLLLREALGDAGEAFRYIAQRATVGPPVDDLEDVIAAARDMGADVIVLDTLARTFGECDENAARDMGLSPMLIGCGPRPARMWRSSITAPRKADPRRTLAHGMRRSAAVSGGGSKGPRPGIPPRCPRATERRRDCDAGRVGLDAGQG